MSGTKVWATVASAIDYTAFGTEMNGRTFSDSTYRYGFNGEEKDDNGEWGNTSYDFSMRIYNPSIGRFLSVDPLTNNFSNQSPYQGRDIESLTKREKIRLGMALYTIQDAVSHKGKRSVSTHKEETEATGHKNEHPDFAEVVQEKGSDKAFNLTEAAIEFIQGKKSDSSGSSTNSKKSK